MIPQLQYHPGHLDQAPQKTDTTCHNQHYIWGALDSTCYRALTIITIFLHGNGQAT